jgi:hypothetical protein
LSDGLHTLFGWLQAWFLHMVTHHTDNQSVEKRKGATHYTVVANRKGIETTHKNTCSHNWGQSYEKTSAEQNKFICFLCRVPVTKPSLMAELRKVERKTKKLVSFYAETEGFP